MNTITIPKKEYKNLVRRQATIEKEVDTLKQIVMAEIREERIKPSVLKRWDRISRDMDKGKGYSFSSPQEAVAWLKKL